MTIFDMVKDEPAFKRFCARQSTRPLPKFKPFKIPIPRPKGANSILKENEYTTGRLLRLTYTDQTGQVEMLAEERAYLFKHDGEFNSVLVTYPDAYTKIETSEQGVATYFETCGGLKPEKESEAAA